MVSDGFWQQSQLVLTLEIFGVIAVLGLLALGINAVWKRLRARGFDLDKSLESRAASQIFRALSLILAVAGAVTLFVTVTPGLTPFADRVNANLGLGVMVLFFLWPIIAAQVILGLFAAKGGWLGKEPVIVWTLLVAGYVVFLGVDTMAVKATYGLV